MEVIANIIAFVFSFSIVFAMLPLVIRFADRKKLYDIPDQRKHHDKDIAALGGVSIVAGAMVSAAFFVDLSNIIDFKYVLAGLLLLFVLGLRDDVIRVKAIHKLIFQLTIATFIVLLGDIRIENIYGIFGIDMLNFAPSVIITVLFLVLIVNAYNWIDGVDFLGAIIGMIVFLFLGVCLFITKQYDIAMVTFIVAGNLLGFSMYNYPPARIFMGDSGSMTIGMLIGLFIIRFNETSVSELHLHNIPLIASSLMAVPVFDLIRVTILRIWFKKNPMNADRTHIHHHFIDKGYSFKQTIVVIVVTILLTIGIALLSGYYNWNNWLTVFILVLPYTILYWLSMKKKKNED